MACNTSQNSALTARATRGFQHMLLSKNPPTCPRTNHPAKNEDHQDFIAAITACLPDLKHQLAQELNTGKSTTYQQDAMTINALERALSRAGYAFTGRRITTTTPRPEEWAAIGQAAEQCKPLMDRRYNDFIRAASTPETIAHLNLFCKRSTLFQQATNTLAFYTPNRPRPDPLPKNPVIAQTHEPALA